MGAFVCSSVFLFLFLASHGVSSAAGSSGSDGNAGAGGGSSLYESLLKHVKATSNPKVIPRPDASQPLKVDFQAAWAYIRDVDYERGYVEGVFFTYLFWNSSVTWRPSDFNGKTHITVSSRDVYIPKVNVINFSGKHEKWFDDVVFLIYDGSATFETSNRGKVYCDNLDATNTCRLRAGNGGSFNDVLSFLEPSERRFDKGAHSELFYFKGSRYAITSHKYQIQRNAFQLMKFKFEYEMMDYTFSFKEKHESRRPYKYKGPYNYPMNALFKF